MAGNDDIRHVLGLQLLQLLFNSIEVGLRFEHVLFGSENWWPGLPIVSVITAHGNRVDHDEPDEGLVVGVVEFDVDGVVVARHDPSFELVRISNLSTGVAIVIMITDKNKDTNIKTTFLLNRRPSILGTHTP